MSKNPDDSPARGLQSEPMTKHASTPASLPDLISVQFDGSGGGVRVDPLTRATDGGFTWVHLRRDAPGTAEHLARLALDSEVLGALTAEETRPRCTVHKEGILLNLRGVNLDQSEEPEDMVSVRLWLTADRVVGVWIRPLLAIRDLLDALDRGQGPVSPGDFVSKLAVRLADRAEPSVAALNEDIDELEEAVDEPVGEMLRADLSRVRRSAILLRRFMVPQKDALSTMQIEDIAWLSDRDRMRLREATERVVRLGEDLDTIRDRSQVVHEQIMDQRAELLNRRMLLLAMISVIFLPLSLITGLLGVNVGGIPGAHNPLAFGTLTGILVVVGAALYVWMKRSGLIP